MEIERKNALKQQSSKFFRETMGTSNSCETLESSTFYQNNHHNNSQIERKRSRIGSKLCLLEEQLSIEYEDISHEMNNNDNNIEQPNEIKTDYLNKEKVKYEKAQSEKLRKQSLFSENNYDNHNVSNNFFEVEKIVKINLLIDDKNKVLKDDERLICLNLKIDSNITMFDLIKISVDAFNDKFRIENFKYLLSNDYNTYKLKASKKNGLPNKDIPAFSNCEKAIKTNFSNFSLIYNENDLLLNTRKIKCIDRCIIM